MEAFANDNFSSLILVSVNKILWDFWALGGMDLILKKKINKVRDEKLNFLPFNMKYYKIFLIAMKNNLECGTWQYVS